VLTRAARRHDKAAPASGAERLLAASRDALATHHLGN
jgi:hypothetical protein